MPISEDEYDHQNGNNVPQQSGMSKAELRRSNKPIMEKRRRARINHCLNELKTLILDALKKDPARHSKLEKADILEMTVKHLQNIQRQQAVLQTADAGVLHRFRSGFSECAGEVSRCISGMEGVDPGVRQRLVAHLSTCVQQMNPFQPLGAHTTSNPPILPTSFAVAGDVNNNGNNDRIQIPSGIQLIPSRLPTGELALLLPNSSNMPFFSTSSSSIVADSSSQQKPESSVSSTKPGHLSAFTTVTRSQSPKMLRPKTSSPPLSPASSTTSFGDDYKISSPSPNISGQVVITTPYSAQYTQTYTFKNVPQKAEQKPQQQQVTSTSVIPDKNLEQSSEMKISYQSVPIYQHTEKPRVWNSSQNLDHDKPLSVITSDKYKVPYTPQDKEYYSRKRHYRESETESLLIVASPKVPKYSPEIVSSSQRSLSSMGSPENVANKSSDSLESLSFKSSPSTSSSANTSASSSGSNESMWRPW